MMQPNKKHMALRYFFASFSITFFALAICVAVFVFITARPQEQNVDTAQSDVPIKQASYTDRESILFALKKEGQADPMGYLLIGLFPDLQKVMLTVFPPDAPINVENSATTLAQAYRYAGVGEVRSQLAEQMRIPIKKYVELTPTALSDLVDLIGGFYADFPTEITLDNQVKISAAKQFVGGELFSQLVQYYASHEDAQHIELLCVSVMQNLIDAKSFNALQTVFEKSINSLHTNASLFDLIQKKDALEAMLGTAEIRVVSYHEENYAQLAREYR